MNSNTITKGLLKTIGIVFGFCLVGILLFNIKSIIVYVVFASILTLIGKPIADFLNFKFKFNRTVATLLTMSLFVVVLLGLIALFIPLFIDQGESLSFLNYEYMETNMQFLINEVYYFLDSKGVIVENLYDPKELLQKTNFDFIPLFFNSLLNIFTGLSIGIFATLFITFYLIKENNILKRVLLGVTLSKHHSRIENATQSIKLFLSRYFIGLFFQITLLFLIYAIALRIFDIPNAFVIAFLCALLNLIPYIGPLIGIFLILTLSLIGIINEDFNQVILPTGIYIGIIYFIAQIFDNFVSQPLIFSKSTKSHPLEIFILILISGILFGILGMMIAIPFYTTTKVIAKEFFPDNRIIQFFTKNM